MQTITADLIFDGTQLYPQAKLVYHPDGTIEDLISTPETGAQPSEARHYRGLLCPGFVNVHCHLELSWMKGLIEPGRGINHFIQDLTALPDPGVEIRTQAMIAAEAEMTQQGIVAVGDVSNHNFSFALKDQSPLSFHTFIELFGSDPKQADRIFAHGQKLYQQITQQKGNPAASLVMHATYSVSAPLFQRIQEHALQHQSILSMHHQESEEENLFFKKKTGAMIRRMEQNGIPTDHIQAAGKRPLEAVGPFLPKNNPLILVHNLFSKPSDIHFAQNHWKELFWCLCPISNKIIENRFPDPRLFNPSQVVLGTDSLASNHQLSIWQEILALADQYPEIRLEDLLQWGTSNGARALNMDHQYGHFARGKKPGILLLEPPKPEDPLLHSSTRIKRIV